MFTIVLLVWFLQPATHITTVQPATQQDVIFLQGENMQYLLQPTVEARELQWYL